MKGPITLALFLLTFVLLSDRQGTTVQQAIFQDYAEYLQADSQETYDHLHYL